MSSRKRTKRKNSEEDFDVDEEDDGMDNDDINKWACHSCTFMNRAAAYRCHVCGTRKGTSTRRSRCNDNVVEMQKTITTMVQKQVEKEKSLKRRERSLMKSLTREASDGPVTKEVKLEDISDDSNFEKTKTPVSTPTPSSATPDSVDSRPKSLSPASRNPSKLKLMQKQGWTPKKEKPESANSSLSTAQPEVTVDIQKGISLEKESTPSDSSPTPVTSETDASLKPVTPLKTPTPPKESTEVSKPLEKLSSVPSTSTAAPSIQIPPNNTSEVSILHHLPERIVKKINQHCIADHDMLLAHKRKTGIDPIVAEAEAVLLPQDWNRQKVMKELVSTLGTVSGFYASPTTSRQSSETDSSSSEANRSFETPVNDSSPLSSKSCQIPDYMIHRETPQKIFIVANGYPAYFEEFPRRIQ